jgi:signal transduction histidine kinase/ligand-binding sensor domain-containing protein/DNA-binding NarL/FixJ family response regulator
MKKFLIFGIVIGLAYDIILANNYGLDKLPINVLTQKQGLSSPKIYCIEKDCLGFFWFGTESGLSRYDGNHIKVFNHIPGDSCSLPNDRIHTLFEDKKEQLWVGTSKGLCLFDRKSEDFKRFVQPTNLQYDPVTDITQDSNGKLWISHLSGLYTLSLDENTHQMFACSDGFTKGLPKITKLFLDHQETLWIGTWGNGIFIKKADSNTICAYAPPHLPAGLNIKTLKISANFVTDHKNNLWVGTWGEGLVRISSNRETMHQFKHQRSDTLSINGNNIKSIISDHRNNLWVGMEESGLDRMDLLNESFYHYFTDFQSMDEYEGVSIYSLYFDNQSLLWMGFRNNGIKAVSLQKTPFFQISKKQNNYQAFSILESEGYLYIATRGGIDEYDVSKKSFNFFRLPNNETPSCLDKISTDSLLIGTFPGRIYLFNRPGGTFTPLLPDSLQKIFKGSRINALRPLSKDRLLITGKNGLYIYHLKNYTLHQISDEWIHSIFPLNKKTLWMLGYRDDKVFLYDQTDEKLESLAIAVEGDLKACVLDDSSLYLGTDLGFFKKNLESQKDTFYANIFPYKNNQVNSMEMDHSKNIWFSSDRSLICYSPADNVFRTFDLKDGLPRIRFRDGVSSRLVDNRLAFGGDGGIVIIEPDEFLKYENHSNLVFTHLKIINDANKKSKSQIKTLYNGQHLTMHYEQNVIEFHFSLLSYINPSKHRYQYKLEGFQAKWHDLGNKNYISFTGLNPGYYKLHVRGTNEQQVWSSPSNLSFYIQPPFWQTGYAFILYTLITGLIIYIIWRYYWNKQKLSNQIQLHQMKLKTLEKEIEHESEYSKMRLRLFTNISHELRTPLSLILAPLESFVRNNKTPGKYHLTLMYKNTRRLNRLVDQILDLRKIETGNLKIERSWGDIIRFSKETACMFLPMAKQKNITYQVKSNKESLFASFDSDKIEKILYNLLSNSFKHTTRGEIKLLIFINNEENRIEYHLTDTGTGMHKKLISRIFDRFYQADSIEQRQTGSGIGLAYVKEIVALHEGNITVESESGEGSTFKIYLPLIKKRKYQQGKNQIEKRIPDKKDNAAENGIIQDADELPEKAKIVVVEDNEELRTFLSEELSKKYQMLEATNGQQGLLLTKQQLPDLVISDIMMAGMNGIQLCHEIKKNHQTSHIPVILLTAHGSHLHQIKGYKSGADDYLTKPFSVEILDQRIKNILLTRATLQEKYNRELKLNPKNVPLKSMDEEFLTKAIKIIEENLDNPDFNADFFSSKMFLSRVHLYRKLKALTGQSISEFVKLARLKLAAELIREKKMTIKEASFTVGFKDPKYFTKCFKQQFDMNPSAYVKK